MYSPIENRIGQVFVPVSDMDRAIAWYSRLLGLPVAATSHEGKIYDVPMVGDTRLTLDGHKAVTNSSQPLFFFWTGDIQATATFLRANDIAIVGEIADIGSVSILSFRDPDNNLLLVCQRHSERPQ